MEQSYPGFVKNIFEMNSEMASKICFPCLICLITQRFVDQCDQYVFFVASLAKLMQSSTAGRIFFVEFACNRMFVDGGQIIRRTLTV